MFRRNLDARVSREPLDTCNCELRVDSIRYHLRLQVCAQRKLLPLQAIKMERCGEICTLITEPRLLGALTELLLAKYSA